eukprot:TRINITY_DN149_c0_g1_i4.p1 TRINITY_DN149_c0_g1~~TRINITY_DN149_c0_g1_i4.p1  ORF type:complete len:364 (+),score=80.27 TRINITY_DN149_c0_g1_i4:25-1116(+)
MYTEESSVSTTEASPHSTTSTLDTSSESSYVNEEITNETTCEATSSDVEESSSENVELSEESDGTTSEVSVEISDPENPIKASSSDIEESNSNRGSEYVELSEERDDTTSEDTTDEGISEETDDSDKEADSTTAENISDNEGDNVSTENDDDQSIISENKSSYSNLSRSVITEELRTPKAEGKVQKKRIPQNMIDRRPGIQNSKEKKKSIAQPKRKVIGKTKCLCCHVRLWVLFISTLSTVLYGICFFIVFLGLSYFLSIETDSSVITVFVLIIIALSVAGINSILGVSAAMTCSAPDPRGRIMLYIYIIVSCLTAIFVFLAYVVTFTRNRIDVSVGAPYFVTYIVIDILAIIPFIRYLEDWK